MKILMTLSIGAGLLLGVQDVPPDQPHTEDPTQCTAYCYPKGASPQLKPKGVPEGAKGYECQGDKCANTYEGDGTEDLCSEHSNNGGSVGRCTRYCAKACCSCLAACE